MTKRQGLSRSARVDPLYQAQRINEAMDPARAASKVKVLSPEEKQAYQAQLLERKAKSGR